MTYTIRPYADKFVISNQTGTLQRDGGFGLGEPLTFTKRNHAEAKAAWLALPTLTMSKGERRSARAEIAERFDIPADIANAVIS